MKGTLLRRTIARAKKLLLYALRLGPLRGPIALVRLDQARGGVVPVEVPSLPRPLYLRSGTSDVRCFQEVFLDRDYAVTLPRSPGVIVDVGANVGCAAVYFAHRHPGAQVVAVEPEAGNLELLRLNCAGYANVTTVAAALWHRTADLVIDNPQAAPWAFRVREAEPSDDAPPLRGITLPEILASALGPAAVEARIDLLKIDIEGAEMDVFARPVPWLDRVDVLVIELHDRLRPGCEEAVRSRLPPETFDHSVRGVNAVFLRRDTHVDPPVPGLRPQRSGRGRPSPAGKSHKVSR